MNAHPSDPYHTETAMAYGAAVGAGIASSAAYLGHLTIGYLVISLAIAVGLGFEFASKRKVTQEDLEQ